MKGEVIGPLLERMLFPSLGMAGRMALSYPRYSFPSATSAGTLFLHSIFFKKYYYFTLCLWVFLPDVCLCTMCLLDTCWDQKASDPLRLGLQTLVGAGN